MDPSPFREKDLAIEAEEFIVDWARELPKHEPLLLTIHLGKTLIASTATRVHCPRDAQ